MRIQEHGTWEWERLEAEREFQGEKTREFKIKSDLNN